MSGVAGVRLLRERVRLDWRVPAAEWGRFREYVENEYGSLDGYLGREAEAAMQAYADADGLDGVEDKIDRLVRAAGRTPEDRDKEKNNSYQPDAETTRVTARVDECVKDEFRAVVDTQDKDRKYGQALARALDTHRNGGRAGRLERKLDRVVDDAEAFLEQTSAESSETKVGKHERCVIGIANELAGEFVDDELERTIREVANVHSEPAIEQYREDVTARLEVEPHPNVPHLWISSEKAEQLNPGVPAECRRPVGHLDSSERVERIRLALGRRAARCKSGRITVPADEVRDTILEKEVKRGATLSLMRSAAQVVGIDIDEDASPAKLRINLSTLQETEPDLTRRIITYRDETREGLLAETTETEMSDYTNTNTEADASGAAAAATDGGEDNGF